MPTSQQIIDEIIRGERQVTTCSVEQLAGACQHLNAAYRAGRPIVDDATYDQVFIEGLHQRQPAHPYLHQVESEDVTTNPSRLVQHARPMLSTAKIYEIGQLRRHLGQVEKAAQSLGLPVETLTYRLTAKLDGIAGNDEAQRLVTRGNGLAGTDITWVFDAGVTAIGGRGLGRGELVVDEHFFHQHLGKGTTHDMDHARNFIAGLCGADTLKAHHHLALDNHAIHFMPFSQLPSFTVSGDTLLADWERLYDELTAQCPYATDGIVVEVSNDALRESMGATGHHERGVAAIKRQGEVARSVVIDIILSTGRTGRIVPTLKIEPISLSGATVSRATAHTAATLVARGLGPGAVCTFVRSGEVIPKLVAVLEPANPPMVVTHCPSCGHDAIVEGEHMVCPNTQHCVAQAESRLRHFFHTLGNIDLFGPETVSRLVSHGVTTLPAIYALTTDEFTTIGFGPGQASNLVAQLQRSLHEPIEEWRFLAAFGIRHLGRGDSRHLLDRFGFAELGFLTADQIATVPGFGPVTSPAIAESLNDLWPLIISMRQLGFHLTAEERGPTDIDAPLSGEQIVFTGTMEQGSRGAMESQARQLGATVQASITGKTTMLVTGGAAGSKLKKAQTINEKAGRTVLRILSESEYIAQISESSPTPSAPKSEVAPSLIAQGGA